MASVDVVIPCYNYAKYLPGCIASVLSQTGVDVRALIIDDCSTDDTPAVGEALSKQDSRVLYRRHAKNMRHIATYNEGLIDWASADYSVLLSADDLLAPDALRLATRVMDLHPNVHLTYGMALLFTDESELSHRPLVSSTAEYQLVPGAAFVRRCIIGNPVPTPSAVVRTSMQKRVGGYSATLPHTADMEMWMRFAVYGDVGVISQVIAYKRTHAANMSIRYADRPLGDFRERIEACRELLASHGTALGTAAPTLDEANELIGTQLFWWASTLADNGQSKACDEALELAAELAPHIRNKPEWQRLRVKRMLPGGVRRGLMSIMERARGTGAAPVPPETSPARQIGWWPEDTKSTT